MGAILLDRLKAVKNHLLLTLEEVKEVQAAHYKSDELRHDTTLAANQSLSSRLDAIHRLLEEVDRDISDEIENKFDIVLEKLVTIATEIAPFSSRHELVMMHVQPLNQKADQLKNEVAALSRVVIGAQPLNEKVDQLTNEVAAFSQRLQHIEAGLQQLVKASKHLNESLKSVKESFSSSLLRQDYLICNPEVALLMHLRSFLPNNRAVDIGANKGDVSEALLASGYEVFAFEPLPDVRENLEARLGSHQAFHILPFGVGIANAQQNIRTVSVDKAVEHLFESDLSVYAGLLEHALPEGMHYDQSISIAVKSLRTLHDEAKIPEQIAVLKIDTEGNDLNVIEGMGDTRYNVVVCEFWDEKHFFSGGQFGLLKPVVSSMRSKGYLFHIVIYRIWHEYSSSEPRFFCNFDRSVEHSWGNVVFFNDFAQFKAARDWCQSVLREAQIFG